MPFGAELSQLSPLIHEQHRSRHVVTSAFRRGASSAEFGQYLGLHGDRPRSPVPFGVELLQLDSVSIWTIRKGWNVTSAFRRGASSAEKNSFNYGFLVVGRSPVPFGVELLQLMH